MNKEAFLISVGLYALSLWSAAKLSWPVAVIFWCVATAILFVSWRNHE